MRPENEKPIDFSKLARLEVREGSFEEMMARRAARQTDKVIQLPKVHDPVRPYWASAIAALLVLGIGLGAWIGLREDKVAPPQPVMAQASSSAASENVQEAGISDSASLAEAVQWYGELGAGSSSEPLQVADAMYDAF